MSRALAVRRSRAAAAAHLTPAEIGEIEAAFASREPAGAWVGYAVIERRRLALFFRSGDPVLTLSRDAAGTVTLSDRRGTVVASAHSLAVLLRWLEKLGAERGGGAPETR